MKESVFYVRATMHNKVEDATMSYKFAKKVVNLNTTMGYSFLVGTLMAFQLDFLLAAWANMRFIQTDGLFGTLNFAISVLVIFVYFGTIAMVSGKQRAMETLEAQDEEDLNKIELYEKEQLK
jgi:site-specific recombinase